MKLFKYLSKENLEKFLTVGNLRLGTLLDFQKGTYGDMVSDPGDGIKTYGGDVKKISAEEAAEYPLFSAMVRGVGFEDCYLSNIQLVSENFYIYSTSANYSPETHKQWSIKEKYDACLVINSPALFMAAISKAIRLTATYCGLYPVNYHPNKSIDINSPLAKLHPALLKFQRDFGNQNEMRAIWSPRNNSIISPIIINVPSAIEYCSVYKVLEQEMKKD